MKSTIQQEAEKAAKKIREGVQGFFILARLL